MTTALHPDAITAKYRTLKDWREARTGGPESLAGWQVTRTEDGSLLLSGRVTGPNPAAALREFGARQQMHLSHVVDPAAGDQPPFFDLSAPDRTAFTWRLGGVWVEVWHPNTPVPVPAPPVPAQPLPRPVPTPPRRPAVTVTTPSGRLPLGARLTRIRRTLTKEN